MYLYLYLYKEHNEQYAGETRRCLKVRLEEHLADIKHKRDKPVSNNYSCPELIEVLSFRKMYIPDTVDIDIFKSESNHSLFHNRIRTMWDTNPTHPSLLLGSGC